MRDYDYSKDDRRDAIKRRRDLVNRMNSDKKRVARKKAEEEENKKNVIQPKLEIGASDDAHEQHADAVAKKVINNEDASHLVQNQPSVNPTPQTKEEEEGTLMAKSEDGTLSGTEKLQTTLDSSKGGGQTLDDKTQNEMDDKMGADLSDVKIHTDNKAHEMSKEINAKAFTHGQDVYFKQGNFDTTSTEGKELLAHELAHTQQQKGGVSRKIRRKGGGLLNSNNFNNLAVVDPIDFDKAIAYNQKNISDKELIDQWIHKFYKLTGKRDFFFRAVASGQAGHDFALFVAVVQEFLNASIKTTLKVDGALGPLTIKAFTTWVNNAIAFNKKSVTFSDKLIDCLSAHSDMPDLASQCKAGKKIDTENFAFLTASAQREIYPDLYPKQDGKCGTATQNDVGINKVPETKTDENKPANNYSIAIDITLAKDRYSVGGSDNAAGRMQQTLPFKTKDIQSFLTPPSDEIIEHLLKFDLLTPHSLKDRQIYFDSLSGRFDKATFDSSIRAAGKFQYDADKADIYEIFLANMEKINSQSSRVSGTAKLELMKKNAYDQIKPKIDQLSGLNPRKAAIANAPLGAEDDPAVVLDNIFHQAPYFNRYVAITDRSKGMENGLMDKYQADKETQLKKNAISAIQNESETAQVDKDKRAVKDILFYNQTLLLIKALKEEKTDTDIDAIIGQQAPTGSLAPEKGDADKPLLMEISSIASSKIKTKIDINKLYDNWFIAYSGILSVPYETNHFVVPMDARNAIKSILEEVTAAKNVLGSERSIGSSQWNIQQFEINAYLDLFDLSKDIKQNLYYNTIPNPLAIHNGVNKPPIPNEFTDEDIRNMLIHKAFTAADSLVKQIFQQVLSESKNPKLANFGRQSKQSFAELGAISGVPKEAIKLRSVFYPTEEIGANLENVSVRNQQNNAHAMELLIYYIPPKEKGADYTFYFCSDPKNSEPITAKSIPEFLKGLDDDKELTPGMLFYETPGEKTTGIYEFLNGMTLSELLIKISEGAMIIGAIASGVGAIAVGAEATTVVAGAETVTGIATTISLSFYAAGTVVDMVDKAQKGTLTLGIMIMDLLQVASSILLAGRTAGKLLVEEGVANKTVKLLDSKLYAAYAHGTSLVSTGTLFISYTAEVLNQLEEAKKNSDKNVADAAMERIMLGAFLNFGVMAFAAHMDAKSLNEAEAGGTLNIKQTPEGNIYGEVEKVKIYREDINPYSNKGKTADRIKSHINDEGNIIPANPNGKATIQEHVAGYESRKSDSPYTSFKMEKGEGKTYGDHVTEVDIEKLRNDVKNGILKDVEVVEHDQVIKALDDIIADAKVRYDKNPTEKNLDKLNDAIRHKGNAMRDKEILIKGIIPKEYILVP